MLKPTREENPSKKARLDADTRTNVSKTTSVSATVDDITNLTRSTPTTQGAAADGAAASTSTVAPAGEEEKTGNRITEDNVPNFRILRKIAKSLTRAKYNQKTLEAAIKEKRLPKGLSPAKIPLKLPDVSIETQIAWEEAHTHLNKSLTLILQKHWEDRSMQLATDYEKTLAGIRGRSSPEELTYILKLINQYEVETTDTLNARTTKKIQKEKTVATEEETATEETPGNSDSYSL